MAATGGRLHLDRGQLSRNSIGAVSVAPGLGIEALPNLLSHCHTIAPPLDDEAAARVEKLLRGKDIAALIMEPIICNLAVLIPEGRFMRAVARSCRKYGTLLILDEVACGFGRTGTLFATEHYRVEPDILCLAKAITGGHAPMGATVVTEKVALAAQGKVGFYSTYGWHPLSVEAALATLQYIRRHRRACRKRQRPEPGFRGAPNAAALQITGEDPHQRTRHWHRVRGPGILQGPLRPVSRRRTARRPRGGCVRPVPGPDHRPADGAPGTGHPRAVPLRSTWWTASPSASRR